MCVCVCVKNNDFYSTIITSPIIVSIQFLLASYLEGTGSLVPDGTWNIAHHDTYQSVIVRQIHIMIQSVIIRVCYRGTLP